jgi:hypothetical protein
MPTGLFLFNLRVLQVLCHVAGDDVRCSYNGISDDTTACTAPLCPGSCPQGPHLSPHLHAGIRPNLHQCPPAPVSHTCWAALKPALEIDRQVNDARRIAGCHFIQAFRVQCG